MDKHQLIRDTDMLVKVILLIYLSSGFPNCDKQC